MLNDEAARFGFCLEVFVVVGVATRAILHAVLIVPVVNHLMEQGSNNIFNGPCQCSGTDVDFPHSLVAVHAPSIVKGVMPVCFGRALNGDDRS